MIRRSGSPHRTHREWSRGRQASNRYRLAAFGVLVASWVGSTVLVAPAALATLHREDGDDPGEQISTLHALLLFAVVPIGISLIIALLVSLPSLARGPRYRPGVGWDSTPEWYGGPGGEEPDGGHGVGSLTSRRTGRTEELTGRIVPTGESGDAGDGGSSARW